MKEFILLTLLYNNNNDHWHESYSLTTTSKIFSSLKEYPKCKNSPPQLSKKVKKKLKNHSNDR